MILPALSLIVLIAGFNFAEKADGSVYTSKVTGEEINFVPKKWTNSLPCSHKMHTTWSMKQKPIFVLCRMKKMLPTGQLLSGELTLPNGIIPVPEGTFLVEREKDLSTYNWNSFSLRYGKRASGTVNSNVNIWLY